MAIYHKIAVIVGQRAAIIAQIDDSGALDGQPGIVVGDHSGKPNLCLCGESHQASQQQICDSAVH